MSVFELVDATSEETWYPLGLWATLDEAMRALASCKDPDDFGSPCDSEDYFAVEIRERRYGWTDQGKTIFTQKWRQKYDETEDEYVWEVEPSPEVKDETPQENP